MGRGSAAQNSKQSSGLRGRAEPWRVPRISQSSHSALGAKSCSAEVAWHRWGSGTNQHPRWDEVWSINSTLGPTKRTICLSSAALHNAWAVHGRPWSSDRRV